MLPGTQDHRHVWPFVDVDLGPDLSAEVGPGDDRPTLTARLFYRNRDLAQIEDRYGSLDAMQTATERNPLTEVPYLLWLGLRHDDRWADPESVADLPGAASHGVDTQAKVSKALAIALGSDGDEAERMVRDEYAKAQRQGVQAPAEVAAVEDDDTADPPGPVAEAG